MVYASCARSRCGAAASTDGPSRARAAHSQGHDASAARSRPGDSRRQPRRPPLRPSFGRVAGSHAACVASQSARGCRVTERQASAVFEWRKLIVRSELGASAKLVALVLSTHMDADGGSCFPSLATLSRETSRARSTVCQALDDLDHAGLIERVRGGPGRSTRYRATSSITGLPLVRSPDSASSVTEPEDVHEDVQKISGRAAARPRRGGSARPAGAGAHPDEDLGYLNEAGRRP
jgi:hypothetical protein